MMPWVPCPIGIPALLPATLALALTRTLSGFDRYLLAASGCLVGLYFACWHDGFHLGPRFMYPLLPLLALWTARALPAIAQRWGRDHGLTRGFAIAGFTALVLGTLGSFPALVRQYQAGLPTLGWDPDRAAREAGVRNALILVRESWGAELVARLWALVVPRPDADALYRKSDPCRLDSAVTILEGGAIRGPRMAALLAPLRDDSARPVATPITGDPSLRLVPGRSYSGYCTGRIRVNQTGFTLFAPLLLAREGGNVYARDLGARDTLLLRRYSDRAVYLLQSYSHSIVAGGFELTS